MSVSKTFILPVFNGEYMERNVIHHFEYCLHSNVFECFVRYFQTEWSGFFTLQCELFKVAMFQIINNASLVSARAWGERRQGGWVGGVVNQMWPGRDRWRGRGSKNSQICADIFYGWPLTIPQKPLDLHTFSWDLNLFSVLKERR